MKDPYQALGVDKGDSQDDIKKDYRRLAVQHHPDKGGAPFAATATALPAFIAFCPAI